MQFPQGPLPLPLPRDTGRRRTAAPAAQGAGSAGGRKAGGVDNGTVALAMSGMTFYWVMPLMMARRTRRRRPSRPSGS
ncbi:MAG: hypothetical protein ACM3S1_06385 [Hyphomicrobiales bacterium]